MNNDVNLRDELLESQRDQESAMDLEISDTKLLLADNEANRIQVLKALGLDDGIKEYEEAKGRSLDRKKLEEDYGKDIFHLDEIKNLCLKYDLRLLNTRFYNGAITSELPDKVVEFSKEHDIRVGVGGDTWSGDGDKFYILAPREKFRTERTKQSRANDKDPILFFNTGNNHYKMVYAWGHSLKMFRLIKGFRRKNSLNRYLHTLSIIMLLFIPSLGALGMNIYGSFFLGSALAALASLAFMPWDNGIDHRSNYFTENGWKSKSISF